MVFGTVRYVVSVRLYVHKGLTPKWILLCLEVNQHNLDIVTLILWLWTLGLVAFRRREFRNILTLTIFGMFIYSFGSF